MAVDTKLSDPSPQVSPVAPVQDQTFQTGMKTLGTVIEGISDVREAASERRFRVKEGQYRERLRTMEKAYLNGNMPFSEFQLRAEAGLKEVSKDESSKSRQQLRQITNQHLGFDPTGAAIDQKREAEKIKLEQENARKTDYLKKGGAFDLYGTEEGERFYAERQALEMTRQSSAAVLEIMNSKREIGQFEAKNNLQEYSSSGYLEIDEQVNDIALSRFGKPLFELTDQEIQSLPQEEISAAVLQLEGMKTQYLAGARNGFAGKSNISDSNITEAMAPLAAKIDLFKDRLLLQTSRDSLKASQEFDTLAISNRAMRNPAFKTAKMMADMIPGFQLDATTSGQVFETVLNLTKGTGEFNPGDTPEDRASFMKFHNSLMNGLSNMESFSQDQLTVTSNLIENIEKGVINSYENMDQQQRDVIMEMLQNPKFGMVVNRLPDDAGRVQDLARIASQYANSVVNAAGLRLVEMSGGVGFQQTEVIPRYTEMFEFTVTKNGINATKKPNAHPAADDVLNRLKGKYLPRINKALRARANLEQIPVEQVIQAFRNDWSGVPGFDELFQEQDR